MDRFNLNPDSFRASFVDKVVSRFLADEVGILPTETVYGLMCSIDSLAGQERIYKIKQRDKRKKLQMMIAQIQDVNRLNIPMSQNLKALATRFWPGPLTIVVPDNDGSEVGLRIPDDKFLLAILHKMRKPLLATSANLSGREPSDSHLCNFSDLVSAPDFVIMSGTRTGLPSTVIRLRENNAELIRNGSISMRSIKEILG